MSKLYEPILWPTPEEMQTLIRQAHAERAQEIRQLFTSLFGAKAPDGDDRRPKPEALRAAA